MAKKKSNKAKKPTKAKKPKKKVSKYNRILKQFTAINNSLPEEAKISLRQRRELIKSHLLPQFDKVPNYKLRLKDIKAAILYEYDQLPLKPEEACNLNFIDPSNYKRPVNFYEIDEFLGSIMPDCIYVKVSAGKFGETNIFNTRDYSYGRKGVQQLTESIRREYNKSGQAYYIGYQKLRPNKKNDGQSDSYYLDMVLFINNNPQGETKTTKYSLPKTRQVSSAKRNVENMMEEKFKMLKREKSNKKRAKTAIIKETNKRKNAEKKLNKNPNNIVAQNERDKSRVSIIDRAERAYAKGYITKERLQQIYNENL